MVQMQRSFHGRLPLGSLPRLRGSLAIADGEVAFELDFGKDEIGVAHVRVRADAALPLTCQRTLEVFALPVHVDTRLGLIAHEEDEASLPEGYEPLLIADGSLHLADVIEDELILALPVIPVKPGTEQMAYAWGDAEQHDEAERSHPFAVLSNLKSSKA